MKHHDAHVGFLWRSKEKPTAKKRMEINFVNAYANHIREARKTGLQIAVSVDLAFKIGSLQMFLHNYE